MNYTQAAVDLIKKYEGCRLTAYRCPRGILTIGYGHTSGVKETDKITQVVAEKLLQSDLILFTKQLEEIIQVPLTQNQVDALVSFVFNVGIGNFKTSTMLKLINKNKIKEAALEFPKWKYSGGKVYAGLIARRKSEMELFLK